MLPDMNISNVSIYRMERSAVPSSDTHSAAVSGQPAGNMKGTGGNVLAQRSAEEGGSAVKRNFDIYECETCKNRKYQDGSNDPGVSFKTPAKISPEEAVSAVRSHENEHVSHAKAEAQREGKEIVSQSVTYQTAICPECGRNYVSGGTTRTVFKNEAGESGVQEKGEEKGKYVDELV